MRSKNVLLLLMVFGVIAVMYSTRFGGSYNGIITNSLALLPPYIAALYGIRASRTYIQTSPHGRSIVLISVALLFWALGKTAFFFFRFVFKIYPYPSIADISFLAGYPLLLAGLITEIRTSRSSFKNTSPYIKFLTSLIMALLVLAVLYFGVIKAYAPGDPVLNNLVAMGYGFGDLVLIAPMLYVLKMAVDYRGGRLFMSWALILIALLLKLYGDVFFAIYRTPYTAVEWPFNMIDLVWVMSYLLFAYSFYSTASHVKEVRARIN